MLSRPPVGMFLKAFLPRLRYLPLVSRFTWRKFVGAKRDIRKGQGLSSKPPLMISIRITNRCNQRCSICGQFGENGYMNDSSGDFLLSDISLDDYKKVVDETAHYKPIFYITGGEAFLYKDLFELTAYIKAKGCYVYVITNGALLEKYAETIIEQKWDMLTCSLDGPEEIHDTARGVPGTFQKTARGIKKVLDLRGKSTYPYFLISATVSESNQDHLEAMMETVNGLNPDGLILYLSWFTSEALGKEHAKILKEKLNVDANTWKSYLSQNTSIKTDQLTQNIKKLSRRKFSFQWFPVPFISEDKLEPYYREPENFLGFGPCVSTYLMIDIMPNGDVVTCRDYIDVKVGNILETPLLELWNNDKFSAFRKLLNEEGGVLPQCSRCCGLMGF
ncbi:MAG: radical SAM protein [Candidatus Marinimicrobia bacterium]|nr:radical SAM protein [Candidatus Neomarinimicrobiota bacterium]MCF7904706.1 radical SAM protein [Candidatus Neomarinimicrobiota bacterium]